MINPYVASDVTADLRPRCSMTAEQLQSEWELMSDEERHEVYLPQLRAAKAAIGLEAAAADPSLVAANYAMKRVEVARAEPAWRLLKRAFEIFGPVETVEFFQDPKPAAQPKQLKLFGQQEGAT